MKKIAFLTFIILSLGTWADSVPTIPKLETYVTADQVDEYFSSPDQREAALSAFQSIGVEKVYLETLRTGAIPNWDTLRQARDFLRQHGIEVSAGIATTSGGTFGVPSNKNRYWFNYQDTKTGEDMAELFRRMAALFDEIMIDDFFATDDDSEISQKAKGDRTWPEYRLALMSDFARQYIIQPAREVNPKVQLIEKFPQWYDRFHLFGYNVQDASVLFDRIWVGTETRNPDTPRFGYVVPTEGYINYRWLASITGAKIGGAWFDFGDCTPPSYLMQAYQSVLAGAQEIVLFEAGSLIKRNGCLSPLLERKNALTALGALVSEEKPIGMYAYKPINSDGYDDQGGANLYIFDYIAALGLAPLPVAEVPETAKCVFLARQAAHDPEIETKVNHWIETKTTLLVTPDFLRAAKIAQLAPLYTKKPGLIFWKETIQDAKMIVIDLTTFGNDDFGLDKEMFLPPKPLPVRQWPDETVNALRKELLSLMGVELKGPNNLSVCLYESGLIVLANFNDTPAHCVLTDPKKDRQSFSPVTDFPHHVHTRFESKNEEQRIEIAPWEIAIVKRHK